MYFNIVSVRVGCRYTTVISSLVLPPTPPIHSYYGITFYLYSFLFCCCCFIVPCHHLQQMQESSGEEYMISPKVSRPANWSSIPSWRSARIQSINRKQEKSNNIWKDSEADSGDPYSSSNILLFLFIWFCFYTIFLTIFLTRNSTYKQNLFFSEAIFLKAYLFFNLGQKLFPRGGSVISNLFGKNINSPYTQSSLFTISKNLF